MSVELHDCPECTVVVERCTLERAWDVFWMSMGERRATGLVLVQHAAKRYMTVGRADPTYVAVLTCGHAVPA